MQVNNKKSNVISTAAKCGIIAAGIERAFLPAEAKAAIRNTMFGEDVYLKKVGKAAEKTIKNLSNNSNTIKLPQAIDVNQVKENAKNLYPKMKEITKAANKQFVKTAVIIGLSCAIGKVIGDAIVAKKAQK